MTGWDDVDQHETHVPSTKKYISERLSLSVMTCKILCIGSRLRFPKLIFPKLIQSRAHFADSVLWLQRFVIRSEARKHNANYFQPRKELFGIGS